jgi:hypothetical protein
MCKFYPVFTEDDLLICADEAMYSVKHFREISHRRARRDYLKFAFSAISAVNRYASFLTKQDARNQAVLVKMPLKIKSHFEFLSGSKKSLTRPFFLIWFMT